MGQRGQDRLGGGQSIALPPQRQAAAERHRKLRLPGRPAAPHAAGPWSPAPTGARLVAAGVGVARAGGLLGKAGDSGLVQNPALVGVLR